MGESIRTWSRPSAAEVLVIGGQELRAAVNALHIQLQLLKTSAERRPAADVARRLDGAATSGSRVGAITELMLELAKVAESGCVLRLERFDIADVARAVCDRYAAAAQEAGSQLVADIAGAVVGDWDRRRIDQILAGLLAQAIDHGNGRPVEVRLRGGAGGARIEVSSFWPRDNRFFVVLGGRMSSAGARVEPGTALLARFAPLFVEAHGGTLEATTDRDREILHVTVTLPFDRPEQLPLLAVARGESFNDAMRYLADALEVAARQIPTQRRPTVEASVRAQRDGLLARWSEAGADLTTLQALVEEAARLACFAHVHIPTAGFPPKSLEEIAARSNRGPEDTEPGNRRG